MKAFHRVFIATSCCLLLTQCAATNGAVRATGEAADFSRNVYDIKRIAESF